MWKEIGDREFGKLRTSLFRNRIKSSRISSIQLSNYKDIVSPHRGAVNSLQVDLTEGRYLLSSASDASVAVYDVQRATDYDGSGLIAKHKHILLVDKQHEQGHKYAISTAIWYPIDTGLFITGSYDHYVNVWDTNTTQVVINFKMPGKVYKTAMSPVATSHMLIAAGSEDVQVRLCDISSGAFAHTLSGHRDGVMSVEWSASSEWVLITGGCDGAIRFWDIRRAGCFRVLDQSHSQLGRRPTLLTRSTANKRAQKPHSCSLGLQSSTPKSSSGGPSSAKGRPSQNNNNNKPSVIPQVGSVGRPSQKKMGNGVSIKQSARQVRGSGKQRLHPGMLSSQDRATAHYGAVNGLKVTNDGMYLLSAGSDSRLRLWDIESGCNTLVNYETSRLQATKAIQLAISHDSTLAFVPCMSTTKAFDLWSGKTMMDLRGHYENVNCCLYDSLDQELYTGSNDRKILVWSPSKVTTDELEGRDGQTFAIDQDNWSD
ncbi:WD repeat-containing protein ATCSA-1 isoform X1 [Lycium ferocissimum]|uniref:WD repeat-containing protein ATCSA-1 isoform X1 n=1 Tax=Lycium ferocissimum TaxID=112874 RepID=UPI002815F7E9|nr:WD repeat-containing protein ATCSA-1 isoform X1 [Lycium ferocissimum]